MDNFKRILTLVGDIMFRLKCPPTEPKSLRIILTFSSLQQVLKAEKQLRLTGDVRFACRATPTPPGLSADICGMSLELTYQDPDLSKPSASADVVHFLNSKHLTPKGFYKIDGCVTENLPLGNATKTTTGLIIGNFDKIDAGHLYLIDFADKFVNELTVQLLDSGESAKKRKENLLKYRPQLQIVTESVSTTSAPQHFDYVFAGEKIAPPHLQVKERGAVYIPVDPLRELDYADNEPKEKKSLAQIKRVCIFGPESTGKSTMTKNLAAHFATVAVPEYARTFMETRDNELLETDLPHFARGMMASEEALAQRANRIIFSDTDALTTVIWSNWLYKRVPAEIEELAQSQNHDLYLLLNVDVPWVADPQRYLPEERQSFLDECRRQLEKFKRPYVLISGADFAERTKNAIAACQEILE